MPALQSAQECADLHRVIALLLCWLTLIAVWGVSDRWNVAGARRRVRRGLAELRRPHASHPFDWDEL